MLVVVVVALARAASAEPRTWVGNDESFGELIARDRWSFWGAGLGVTHTLADRVELGLEGSVLRLDASRDADPRHGFALRGAATLGYRVRVSDLAGIDWGIEPQLGAATVAAFGIGDRTTHELFAGVRASFRFRFDSEPSRGAGVARALGGHVTVRLARGEGEYAASFLLGYDWGL
jgi:hypothetical protein